VQKDSLPLEKDTIPSSCSTTFIYLEDKGTQQQQQSGKVWLS